MSKARLYLDVDGCINLFGGSPWPSRFVRDGVATLIHNGFGQLLTEGGMTPGMRESYRIMWAPELIDELNKLDVELVWLTTWCHNASDLIAPLVGLTLPSRVLEPLSGMVSFPSIYWKCESLIQDLEGFDGKFIWIDDEPTPDDMAASSTLSRGLRITPMANFGVTPRHLEQIKAYLASN